MTINSVNFETGEIRIDGGTYKLGERSDFMRKELIDILCPICGEVVACLEINGHKIYPCDLYSDMGGTGEFSLINEDSDDRCEHLSQIEEDGRRWEEEHTDVKVDEKESSPVDPAMAALLAGAGF